MIELENIGIKVDNESDIRTNNVPVEARGLGGSVTVGHSNSGLSVFNPTSSASGSSFSSRSKFYKKSAANDINMKVFSDKLKSS